MTARIIFSRKFFNRTYFNGRSIRDTANILESLSSKFSRFFTQHFWSLILNIFPPKGINKRKILLRVKALGPKAHSIESERVAAFSKASNGIKLVYGLRRYQTNKMSFDMA